MNKFRKGGLELHVQSKISLQRALQSDKGSRGTAPLSPKFGARWRGGENGQRQLHLKTLHVVVKTLDMVLLAKTRIEFHYTNIHLGVIYYLPSRKQKTQEEQLFSYSSMLDFGQSVPKNKTER